MTGGCIGTCGQSLLACSVHQAVLDSRPGPDLVAACLPATPASQAELLARGPCAAELKKSLELHEQACFQDPDADELFYQTTVEAALTTLAHVQTLIEQKVWTGARSCSSAAGHLLTIQLCTALCRPALGSPRKTGLMPKARRRTRRARMGVVRVAAQCLLSRLPVCLAAASHGTWALVCFQLSLPVT